MSRLFILIRSDLPNGSWVMDADKELEFEVIGEVGRGWPYTMSGCVRIPDPAEPPTVEVFLGEDVVESSEEVRTCKR